MSYLVCPTIGTHLLAAAGPISAGVAAGNAIIAGSGQVVIVLVQAAQNGTNGPAAMDAFQTVRNTPCCVATR